MTVGTATPTDAARQQRTSQSGGGSPPSLTLSAQPSSFSLPPSHSQYAILSPSHAAALKTYVYRGSDRSYWCQYVWRPLCQRTVRYIPRSISANTITVSALLLGCLPSLVLTYRYFLYCGYFGGTAAATAADKDGLAMLITPGWCVWNAVTLLLYQYLDNLDGHQARRLRTSSPLGLWADHGCDAIHSLIDACSIAFTLHADPSSVTFLTVVLVALSTFFCQTWEHYHLHELVLPVVNGPNEGVLVLVTIYLWTAYQGSSEWWSGVMMDWGTGLSVTYRTAMVSVEVISGVVTCFLSVWNVSSRARQERRIAEKKSGESFMDSPPSHIALSLLPLVLVVSVTVLFHSLLPARYPMLVLLATGLLFTYLNMEVIIIHMCEAADAEEAYQEGSDRPSQEKTAFHRSPLLWRWYALLFAYTVGSSVTAIWHAEVLQSICPQRLVVGVSPEGFLLLLTTGMLLDFVRRVTGDVARALRPVNTMGGEREREASLKTFHSRTGKAEEEVAKEAGVFPRSPLLLREDECLPTLV